MRLKNILVIASIFSCLLLYLTTANKETLVGQDTEKVIETKNYFELFDPTKNPFQWDSKPLDQSLIESAVVAICQKDYKKAYGIDLKLLKVVNGSNNEHYYVFEVPFHDDEIVVYVHDFQQNEIVYKFFVPMA